MRPTRSRRNTVDSANSDDTFKTAASDLQDDPSKSSSTPKPKESTTKAPQNKIAGKATTQHKASTENTSQTSKTRAVNPITRSTTTRKTANAATASNNRNTKTSKAPVTAKKTTKAPMTVNKTTKAPVTATKTARAPSAKRKRETTKGMDDDISDSNVDIDEDVQESNIKVVKRKKISDSQENQPAQSTVTKRKEARKAEEENSDDDSFWNIEKAFVPSTVRKPTVTFGTKATQKNARSRNLASSTRRADPSTVNIFANLKPSLIFKPGEKPTPPRRTSNQNVRGVNPVTEMVMNNKAALRRVKKVKETDSATNKKRTIRKNSNMDKNTVSSVKGAPLKVAANIPTSSAAAAAATSTAPLTTTTNTSPSAQNVNPAPTINRRYRDKGKGRADDYSPAISSTPTTVKKPISLSKSKNKSTAARPLSQSSSSSQTSSLSSCGNIHDQGPSSASAKKPRFDLLLPSASSQRNTKPSTSNKPDTEQMDVDMEDVSDKPTAPVQAAQETQQSLQSPTSKAGLPVLDELSINDTADAQKDDNMLTIPKQPAFPSVRQCTPPPLSPTSEAQKVKFLQSTPTLANGSREVTAFDIFGNCPLSPISKPDQLTQFDILQSTPIISTSSRTRQLIMTEEDGSPQRIRRISPPKSPTGSTSPNNNDIVGLEDEPSLPLDIEKVISNTGITDEQKNMRVDDYIMSVANQSIDTLKEYGQKQIEMLREKSNRIKSELTQQLEEKYGNDQVQVE